MQAERAKKEAQTLGRSSGGFCTKLHLFLDNQERLLGIELSGDQESDHKYASALVFEAIEHKSRSIVDDKGYDSLAFHAQYAFSVEYEDSTPIADRYGRHACDSR